MARNMTPTQSQRTTLQGVKVVANFYCGVCKDDRVDDDASVLSSVDQEYGNPIVENYVTVECPVCNKTKEFADVSLI